MRANDLMTKQPTCASTSDTVQEVARLMAEHDCGCVPVVDDRERQHVIGVVTDRDIAVRGVARGKAPNTRVGELMTRDVVCVSQDADIDDVERLMSDRQIRRVVVADADGCCVGMISQADLARAAREARDVDSEELARVVEQISQPKSESIRSRMIDAEHRQSSAGLNPPPRSDRLRTPRYGSAGSGGAEYEPGPERD